MVTRMMWIYYKVYQQMMSFDLFFHQRSDSALSKKDKNYYGRFSLVWQFLWQKIPSKQILNGNIKNDNKEMQGK